MKDCSGEVSPWLFWSSRWPAGMAVTVTEKDIIPPAAVSPLPLQDTVGEVGVSAILWFSAWGTDMLIVPPYWGPLWAFWDKNVRWWQSPNWYGSVLPCILLHISSFALEHVSLVLIEVLSSSLLEKLLSDGDSDFISEQGWGGKPSSGLFMTHPCCSTLTLWKLGKW